MILTAQSLPNNILAHHGILGMKWGRKNGPPYPIGVSDHSASEKKAGWRKSLDKSDSNSQNDNKKHGLSDKQKKAIKIGIAATATALAAYGTYKLAKSGKLDKYVETGKTKVNELLGKKKSGKVDIGKQKVNDLFSKTSKSTTKTVQTVNGIKKLAKGESLEDTLKNVNSHSGTNKNYSNNCTLCSITTFLRQAGLDVKAGSTGGKPQQLGDKVEACFKGAKVLEGSAGKFGRSRKDAAEMLINKFGQNASGVCSIQWKKEYTPNGRGGGHAFNWSIKDGVVKFFDGQANKNDNIVSNYWKMIDPNGGLTLARLDNAEINFDGVKELLEF